MTNDQKIEAYTLIMGFMNIIPRMVSPGRYSISDIPWYTTIQNTPEKCIESVALSDGLKYFSSWDQILPLYDEVQNVIGPISDGTNGDHENCIGNMSIAILELDKDEAIKQALIAIKWHNQNKQQ